MPTDLLNRPLDAGAQVISNLGAPTAATDATQVTSSSGDITAVTTAAALGSSFKAAPADHAHNLANDVVTDAKLRNSAARSVIGRAANSTGDPADIAGGGAGTYLGDNATSLAFRALTDIIENLNLSGDISPSQLTADQNDYNPANLATSSVLRLSTDATRTITGLAGGADGRVILIINVGSNSLVLADGSASSSAANRFAFGADRTLGTKQGIVLWYDSTSSLWRTPSQPPGAGGGGAPTDATYVTLTTNGTLSDERTLAGESSVISITDGGAGSTVTVGISSDGVTNAKLRNSGARSVIGRSANSTGDPADISGGGAGQYLSDDGSTLAFRRVLPRVVSLTDAANISVDASLIGQGDAFTVTLGGNRTMDAPTNATSGQWMTIVLIQDATGSRTITWASGAGAYRFTTDVVSPTLSTGANKIDYILFRYHAGDNRWDAMAFNKAA